MTDARLSEAREYAVQSRTLLFCVTVANQPGVAEPVVQRQGADRIVVELPASVIPLARKKFRRDRDAGIW